MCGRCCRNDEEDALTPGKTTIVTALGSTQTVAWASSYYLPAILGAPIAAALHLSTDVFFGIFSASLLLSAVLGPAVGRMIDRQGGRTVLAGSNLVIAAGLVALALAQGIVGLAIAWLFLSVGIAAGLYDSAFAALTALYGRDARNPITGITLIAGFASTIGWPATAFFLHAFGWREACLIWAALNFFVAMPVNWFVIPAGSRHRELMAARPSETADAADVPRSAMVILAFFFSAAWFVTGAMAAQLPRLLVSAGATGTAAIAAAALVGPAQVAARIIEFGLMRNFHPLISARIAAALHPVGAALLTVFGASGAVGFAVFHGAGNGMITIAKGTLPLAIFGPAGFGLRSGVLSAPARVTQAAGPFVFGLLLDRYGDRAVLLSAGLSIAASASLLLLRVRAVAEPA
ncbi:MAG TPA: MFS transporter [Stellaceae bacterium]|nr:MFS transporter [Stellaceae bacterium]